MLYLQGHTSFFPALTKPQTLQGGRSGLHMGLGAEQRLGLRFELGLLGL